MKDIPTHFVSNFDKVGNCNFDLVKKHNDVYLYHRTNMDATHVSYEVFLSKFVAKGTPLPGGVVEKEDRMAYPGANAFGKTAYDCKTIGQAENRYDELLVKSKDKADNKELSLQTGKIVRGRKANPNKVVVVKNVGGKRGRKRMDVNFQLPDSGGTFTMKQLVASSGVNQPLLYIRIQELIHSNKVIVSGSFREEGARGKSQVVYTVVA